MQLASDRSEQAQSPVPADFPLGVEGFYYSHLHQPGRLRDLAACFIQAVAAADPDLSARFSVYQANHGEGMAPVDVSQLLIQMAPHLSRFVARLFQVESDREAIIEDTKSLAALIKLKKVFVERRVLKQFQVEEVGGWDFPNLERQVRLLQRLAFAETLPLDDELGIARMVAALLRIEKDYDWLLGPRALPVPTSTSEALRRLKEALQRPFPVDAGSPSDEGKNLGEALGVALSSDPALSSESCDLGLIRQLLERIGKWLFALKHLDPARVSNWVSFRPVYFLDYSKLVKLDRPDPLLPHKFQGPPGHLRHRDGFKLSDRRFSPRDVLSEVNYCIYCHERDKDSCSKGLREKDGTARHNPLGISLEGCPLGEKISEMHWLKKEGDSIGALALALIDNPMCPGTGHRICNDCMKSCIFQRQTPVNIPQIETGVLTDVLGLPYGFEIYDLLTRWNPLRVERPFELPYNGKNVLIVGMGPAGYTLAHFLLNEGFGVVGIDGLKIEPLDAELLGNETKPPRAIRDIRELQTELDSRVLAGFGGVSEYGITVRWDKNFLTLIHLALRRRRKFKVYGGVRFGGTLTIDDAWRIGFDHIAIAAGAGKPSIIDMKNNLVRGIRKASDFLMALQLTGAFKKTAMANLQVQLPALVIGGGLTAIDAATELAAYYPLQVEKLLHRFKVLAQELGEDEVWKSYEDEERAILKTFLEHGRIVGEEREAARRENREPDFVKLVRQWGGVSVVYRKSLQESPAYRLNHEEVIKSLEEGIYFIEGMTPQEALTDDFGAVAALRFERMERDENGNWRSSGQMVTLPGKTVCVAAGTSPNIIYEREYPGTFKLDERQEYFATYKLVRNGAGEKQLQPATRGEKSFFTSYQKEGRHITYYGDNHPAYAGNVVKAMASAKEGYPQIAGLFSEELANLDPAKQPAREEAFRKLAAYLDRMLLVAVFRVNRLTPTIVEVIVRAPFAAERFRPGQFYRLQNFEISSPVVEGTKLTMEGLALTGAWVDKDQGLLSMVVLEMGGSSRLCAMLRPGQSLVVMGPTGTPTEIPQGKLVLLAGGGLGNAVLFSIGKALLDNGNQVLYFAGYKKGEDLYKQDDVESSCDQLIWATDAGQEIIPRRPQDRHFRGNILQAMQAYAEGELGVPLFDFRKIDRIIAIGSDRMMAAVKEARRPGGVLGPYLCPDHVAIGSINSPMQCMMKEVCAQCLQKRIDPVTGQELKPVFSCFNQDQILDEVDFKNLNDRLRANAVLEKLATLWLDHLLEKHPQPGV